MGGSLTRRRWAPMALILVLGLAALPVATLIGPVAAQDDATVEVDVVDFAFEPATLTIRVGTTVNWTNRGQAPHTVTADDGAFDSGNLAAGDSFSQTFDTPGTYAYHCEIHPRMTATIVVTAGEARDLDAATPQPEAAQPGDDGAAPAGGARDLTPVEQPRLAHIHAGNCEELGIVVYSLRGLRSYRSQSADGEEVAPVEMVVGTADVPLADLFGEPFSIHIHENAQNKQNYLACAEVGTQPDEPWTEADGLSLELAEQGGSGYSGFARLTPTGDGETSVGLFLARSTGAEQAAEARATPPPGTTYTSPTFGYSISYGPTWEVTEEVATAGRDRFVLFNGTSYITFTGVEDFDGDPQRCVDDFVEVLTGDPNVSNLGLAIDTEGNPLRGATEATGAYAIYNHDYTFPDRVEAYTLFVGCIPLVPGEAVLAVVQNVPSADFNDQVEPRQVLLRGLVLPQ